MMLQDLPFRVTGALLDVSRQHFWAAVACLAVGWLQGLFMCGSDCNSSGADCCVPLGICFLCLQTFIAAAGLVALSFAAAYGEDTSEVQAMFTQAQRYMHELDRHSPTFGASAGSSAMAVILDWRRSLKLWQQCFKDRLVGVFMIGRRVAG